MVLRGQLRGRVGRRQEHFKKLTRNLTCELFVFPGWVDAFRNNEMQGQNSFQEMVEIAGAL